MSKEKKNNEKDISNYKKEDFEILIGEEKINNNKIYGTKFFKNEK